MFIPVLAGRLPLLADEAKRQHMAAQQDNEGGVGLPAAVVDCAL